MSCSFIFFCGVKIFDIKKLGVGKSVQDKMQGLEARPLGSYCRRDEVTGGWKDNPENRADLKSTSSVGQWDLLVGCRM